MPMERASAAAFASRSWRFLVALVRWMSKRTSLFQHVWSICWYFAFLVLKEARNAGLYCLGWSPPLFWPIAIFENNQKTGEEGQYLRWLWFALRHKGCLCTLRVGLEKGVRAQIEERESRRAFSKFESARPLDLFVFSNDLLFS